MLQSFLFRNGLAIHLKNGHRPLLSLSSPQTRRLAIGRSTSAKKKKKPLSRRRYEKEKMRKQKEAVKAEKDAPAVEASGFPWYQRFVPFRYRATGSQYTREQFIAMAQRLPFWALISGLLLWEETSPFTLLSIQGPSMLPTMAPDGSDVWIRSTGKWRISSLESYYQRGDIVGFAHPDSPQRVSCKRIVGVAGDRVNRYGQFVHLYFAQDPKNWGRIWPDKNDPTYKWIDRSCGWDDGASNTSATSKEESERVIIVPEGHVWLEADCPGLGIDSRQFGPVPLEWLKGKVITRVWPLWRKSKDACPSHAKRPHPIPLDQETLRKHNVHLVPKSP